MNKYWMGFALAGFVAFGCTDKVDDSGDVSEADADTDTDTDTDPDFDVTWGASSVDVAGSDCTGCTEFGLAETGTSDDPWTGEDCLYGYEGVDATPYCHPFDGASLSLAYGGDYSALAEGSETVFPGTTNSDGEEFSGRVTYYVGAGADCYIWGQDVSYYSGLGCTEL